MARYARLARDGRVFDVELNEASEFRKLSAPPWLGGTPTGVFEPLADAPLLCPVSPSKILCVGRNYRAHAGELGNAVPEAPLFFSKLVSSLLGPNGSVVLPPESERVDYEAELAVVIGSRARRVPKRDALAHVFGYTVACDVTARDLQKKDGQWTRAKGFDTFCPVGPAIVTDVEPASLPVRLSVNGELKQDGSTRDMVFSLAELVEAASTFATLEPGDLLLSGTPAGVGPLAHGDRVLVAIGGVGELEFGVVREAS